VTAEAERNMLAGDVPKCSLEERAALDERLERIEAGSDCDSDELDALEMRMLHADPSPAHRMAVRESGARTRPGGVAEPRGNLWTPPKPPVPVRTIALRG